MKRASAALFALLLGSCAHIPPEHFATSLFLGEWRNESNFREPPGCNEPEVICLNVWADVTFGDFHTLSGPVLPESVTATMGFHQAMRNTTVLVATRLDAAGKRTAWKLDFVFPDESEACFNAEDIARLEMVVPKAAVRRGAQYCIAVV